MADERLTVLFTDIADAIRGKDGTNGLIPVSQMADRVASLPSADKPITVMLSNSGDSVKWYDTDKCTFVSGSSTPSAVTIGKDLIVTNASSYSLDVDPLTVYLLRPGHEEQESFTVFATSSVYSKFGAGTSTTWVFSLPAMCTAGGGDFSADNWKHITKISLKIWDK